MWRVNKAVQEGEGEKLGVIGSKRVQHTACLAEFAFLELGVDHCGADARSPASQPAKDRK
jgi:hypothetical protein